MAPLRIAGAAALIWIGLAISASAAPVLEFPTTSGGNGGIDQNFSMGWLFQTTRAVTVTALDAFDTSGPGGGNVRLYDGNGTVLGSALVTNTDPVVGSPTPFFSAAVTPFSLAANQIYYIVEDFAPNSTRYWQGVPSVTLDPAITYLGYVDAIGQGTNPTTDFIGELYGLPGIFYPAWFGPNFEIATGAVPEPFTLSIFGAGLTGAVAMRRRKKSA